MPPQVLQCISVSPKEIEPITLAQKIVAELQTLAIIWCLKDISKIRETL